MSCIFNIAALVAGTAAWAMSLIALNYQVVYEPYEFLNFTITNFTAPSPPSPPPSLPLTNSTFLHPLTFPSIWELTVNDRLLGITGAQQVAGVVFIFITVIFGIFPPIGSLSATLTSCKNNGGATGCLICGYFMMGIFAACYWFYQLSPTPGELPLGPCVGKELCHSVGFGFFNQDFSDVQDLVSGYRDDGMEVQFGPNFNRASQPSNLGDHRLHALGRPPCLIRASLFCHSQSSRTSS